MNRDGNKVKIMGRTARMYQKWMRNTIVADPQTHHSPVMLGQGSGTLCVSQSANPTSMSKAGRLQHINTNQRYQSRCIMPEVQEERVLDTLFAGKECIL